MHFLASNTPEQSDSSNNQPNSNKKTELKKPVDIKNSNRSNRSSGKKPQQNPRSGIFVILALIVLSAVAFAVIFSDRDTVTDKKPYSELISIVKQGKVSKIQATETGDVLIAEIYKNNEKNRESVTKENYLAITQGSNTPAYVVLKDDIKDSGVKIGNKEGEVIFDIKPIPIWEKILNSPTFQTFILLGGTLLIGAILLKKLSEVNGKSIAFGDSKSKFYDKASAKKVTFADVAGNEEAKQELAEIVDFLKRPEDYTKMGAKIPRGVLLNGSPGNGKTLMARAIAGEAQVPFMYVSGSEFVEMFVGVGASRVRNLFEQAKQKGKCLIFIDEIDAVGRQRGAGLGGGNDEREQTLNQILVEMDGFEPLDYIIVVGATNRPDVLDPALLRPGRFDRQVTVTAPDKREREAILKLHSGNKPFESDVDMTIIAKRTAGFSGADLQNLLNEAAIMAVREKATKISNLHLREAIEKSLLGSSLKSKLITDTQKKLTAYHEAGHALVQTVLPEARKVQKITIIPRGRAGGYTFSAENDNDAMTKSRKEFLAEICALFGGYVTEEIIFGDVSTGGSNDLQKATEMARDMVTKYGMSSLGPISFDQGQGGMSFLGRDMMNKPQYSEDSAKLIDTEIRKILDESYVRTKQIINKYTAELKLIASELIEKEVLEYEEFNALVEHIIN